MKFGGLLSEFFSTANKTHSKASLTPILQKWNVLIIYQKQIYFYPVTADTPKAFDSRASMELINGLNISFVAAIEAIGSVIKSCLLAKMATGIPSTSSLLDISSSEFDW